MIIDSLLQFADNRAFYGTADARVPSLTIDQIKAGDTVGPGALELVIQITDAVVAAGGAANVTFTLETHTADDFSSARTVLWKSAAIAKGTLVAGYQVARLRLPYGLKRYINVVAVTDTNNSTAGKMDAFLVPVAQANDL